ncbi:E3 ubiquitin-protein ligase ORTHRUS 2-like [Impatiens glandulifera]|uniref:E3 ubiquitin-protein ligase ORTHRUS 2-like n=1 Tax=Impatiens glandulifera TaxID=253017 RepID=UPI001FB0EF12|nr:E3 ubiquitin-protein ligase ORTHRUS 2-like [Impatiens glandulifera]
MTSITQLLSLYMVCKTSSSEEEKLAKMGKEPSDSYRAKRADKGNASSGRIFVTVPPDHFGSILAENDPIDNTWVLVGRGWEFRLECRQWGVHLPHIADSGISGQSKYGAQSVVLSGGYEDDGEWFLYTRSGGRDLTGNKRTNKDQSSDQEFKKHNPVRVIRSHKEKRSSYAPVNNPEKGIKGLRYDGIYRVEKCWRKKRKQGFKVCRYLFVRCDNEPAPWSSDGRGDVVRALPDIPELEDATDVFERKESPMWDYDNEDGKWKWTKPPPVTQKKSASNEGSKVKGKGKGTAGGQAKNKDKKELCCRLCKELMVSPVMTPCSCTFCKGCLEDKFSGKKFIRERSTASGRSLRTQKIVMKCPSCTNDIAEFLQNPQVNRDMQMVIADAENVNEEAAEEEEEPEDEVGSEEDAAPKRAKVEEAVDEKTKSKEETTQTQIN